jgi:hypothetical protein
MTSSTPATKPATTRRRGRPKSDNPLIDRRVARLTLAEGRRLNSLMRGKNIGSEAEFLRKLIVDMLNAEGVEDPGPESPQALPPAVPQRKKFTAIPAPPTSDQLALTA